MIRRLVPVAALALVVVQSAAAHAILLYTSPANGAVLASAPVDVSVTFDSTVRPGPRNAAVRHDGQSVLGGRPEVTAERTLVIPLRPSLPPGSYTVRWSVVSDDGHEEEGLVAFAVGAGSAAPAPTLTVHGFVTWQRVVMRTVFFLGVLGAAGVVFFALLVLRPLGLERTLLRPQAHLLFVFFLLAFCGSDALIHAAGAGGTRFERFVTVAAVAAGGGAAAAALAPIYARLRYLAWGAAGVLLVCPTLAGHAFDASQPRVVAPAADLLHLGGAAVWFGGLASLCVVLGRIPSAARIDAVRRFSSVAVAAVGVVAVAGVSRAVTELSSVSQVWSTSYGRTLLIKSGLLATTLGLAWLGRSALLASVARVGRLLPVELLLLAGIAVAVGTLTDLRPGRNATTTPAPTPPNVRLPPPGPEPGAFVDARQAGRFAVGFAYRKSTAVITVVSPDGQGASDVAVTIGGRTPRHCGRGCFTAPVRDRSVVVSVAGAKLRFEAPRRLRPAGAALDRATRVFDSLRSVVVREQLASAPGHFQVTIYREGAPNRLAYRIVSSSQPHIAGSEAILIGDRRWDRRPGGPWISSAQFPLTLPKPFWGPRSRNAFFVAPDEITFFDPSYPAWFRLRFDPKTGRTLELHMTASAHFMTHGYSEFDRSPAISPPATR